MTTERFRDLALIIGGLLLLGYETVVVDTPRALIVTVAVAMLGLPASLLADRTFPTRKRQDPPADDEERTP